MPLLEELQKRLVFARECARVAKGQGDFNATLYNERLGDEFQLLIDRAYASPQIELPLTESKLLAEFIDQYSVEFDEFLAERNAARRRSEIQTTLRNERF